MSSLQPPDPLGSTADTGILFAQPLPNLLPGEAPVAVPIAGWIACERLRPDKATWTLHGGGRLTDLALGVWVPKQFAPLPLSRRGEGKIKPHWVGFSAWAEIYPERLGSAPALQLRISDGPATRAAQVPIARAAPLVMDAPLPVSAARVAICLLAYQPTEEQFRRQIESIRAQDCTDWICLVVDDGSDEASVAMMRQVLGADQRFYSVRSRINRGFYHNCETALSLVPAGIPYIALADQDDDWYPHKLSRLLDAASRPEVTLAYSDMRIVRHTGELISPSYWTNRRNAYRDLDSLLLANTVTGAASLFSSRLLPNLLPFPPRIGDAFHDHWIACTALAHGRIAYVDEPLYDYIQYADNVIGHCDFSPDPKTKLARGDLMNPTRWKSLIQRFIGSSFGVYWCECRRIESFCRTIAMRLPEGANPLPALKLFSGGLQSVARLLIYHFRTPNPRRLTNHAELRLARGYLVFFMLHFFRKKGCDQNGCKSDSAAA